MLTIPDRVLGHVWSRIDVRTPEECWFSTWPYARKYPGIGWGEGGKGYKSPVSRVVWTSWYGPIDPWELTIQHLCHEPGCCNPLHMELWTLSANSADNAQSRRTHCKWGHEFDEANTRYHVRPSGYPMRICRACDRRRAQEIYQRRTAA